MRIADILTISKEGLPSLSVRAKAAILLAFGLGVGVACQMLGVTPINASETPKPISSPTLLGSEAFVSPTPFTSATRPVSPEISPTASPNQTAERETVDNACTAWILLEGTKDARGNYTAPAWHFERTNANEPEPSRQEMVSIPEQIPQDVDTLRTVMDLGGSELNQKGLDDAHFFITAPGDMSWFTARFVDSQFNGVFQEKTIDIPLSNFEGVNDIAGETLQAGEGTGGTLGIRIHDYMPYDVRVYQALLYDSQDPDCATQLGEPDFVIAK